MYIFSLLVVIVTIIIIYVLKRWFREYGLPVLGHLPMLSNRIDLTFEFWSKSWSSVYKIKMGYRQCLVINGLKALKEAFLKNAGLFADRPNFYIYKLISEGKSMAFGHVGHAWQKQKAAVKFALSLFTQRHRSELEMLVNREADDLITSFSLSTQLPVKEAVSKTIGSVIYSLCFGDGQRASEDPTFQKYLVDDEIFIELMNTDMCLYEFVPIAGHFEPCRSQLKKMAALQDSLTTIVRRKMGNLELTRIPNEPRNIGDALLDACQKGTFSDTFTSDHIRLLPVEILGGGHSTVSIALRWAFHFMTAFPQYQEKVHLEIDTNLGSEKPPSWKDRSRLPMCEAVLLEAMRLGTIQPFYLPHATVDDCRFRGNDLKQGALVMVNMRTVLRDRSVWSNPDSFYPERFINMETGEVDQELRDAAPNFGMGKRRCPGELLARIQMFVVFVKVMQKCRIIWKGDKPPEVEGLLQFSVEPYDQHVYAESR